MCFHGRVLVVDDNFLNQMVLKANLEKMGFTADLASNGQEALDLLNEGIYDLTFLDIQMPVMDGIECALHIRSSEEKSLASMPLIAVTANISKYSESLEDCDLNGLVSKPVDVNMLKETIKRCLSDNFKDEN